MSKCILPLRATAFTSALVMLVSCASPPRGGSSAEPAPPVSPPAPWSGERLSVAEVAPVYLDVWRAAENRERCALVSPKQLPSGSGKATARSATFSGGWAVAYDTPEQRSESGVAGTGTSAWSPGIYDQWPHRIVWADGSRAEYGLEGGTGPNWLAYLRIPGQECLYNVWSRRGRTHLEALLAQLRFVVTP